MAINDWNHDGKKDMVDNYIEYQIYKDVTRQKDGPFLDFVYVNPRGCFCF